MTRPVFGQPQPEPLSDPTPETTEQARARRMARSEAMRAEREAMRADPGHSHLFDSWAIVRMASGGCVDRWACRCGAMSEVGE